MKKLSIFPLSASVILVLAGVALAMRPGQRSARIFRRPGAAPAAAQTSDSHVASRVVSGDDHGLQRLPHTMENRAAGSRAGHDAHAFRSSPGPGDAIGHARRKGPGSRSEAHKYGFRAGHGASASPRISHRTRRPDSESGPPNIHPDD